MRPADPALEALLATRQFVYGDCFSVFLLSGTVLRYTNAQYPITYTSPGEMTPHTYTSRGILFDGMRMRSTLGIQVDEQDVRISAAADTLVDGVPLMQALRLGYFDGATVRRDRVYMSNWGEPVVGAITLFFGRVSTVDPGGGTRAIMKVKSELIVLDQNMPRNFFQTSCKNTLFDTGCGLDKNDFAVTGTVGMGATNLSIPWASATLNEYDLGTIHFETGVLVGQTFSIRHSTGSAIILVFPAETPPDAGDQFKAYPGCDLTMARCSGVLFNNLNNFRGFPFVPSAETGLI